MSNEWKKSQNLQIYILPIIAKKKKEFTIYESCQTYSLTIKYWDIIKLFQHYNKSASCKNQISGSSHSFIKIISI